MPTVFVISRDWTLRAAVRAELREANIEALGMESADDAARTIADGLHPSVVVLDGGILGETERGEPTRATLENLAQRVPVIVVASRAELVPPLEHAAAVLNRPVRIGDIAARVEEILRGQAA